MSPLTTGTLTMLFSDIESSTVSLRRLGPHWADALTAHRRILRAVFEAHDGGYIGIDVHRAARIAGTAHGGQIVLSEATRLLVLDYWIWTPNSRGETSAGISSRTSRSRSISSTWSCQACSATFRRCTVSARWPACRQSEALVGSARRLG